MNAADAAFLRLTKMIERELELAGQGRVEELRAAVRETGEYLSTLPCTVPASARPALERAKALRGRVGIETQRLRDSLERSRASLRTSRRLARTYTGASRRSQHRYTTSA